MFVKTIFRHESNVTCFKDVFLPGHISTASGAGNSFIKSRAGGSLEAENGFAMLFRSL